MNSSNVGFEGLLIKPLEGMESTTLLGRLMMGRIALMNMRPRIEEVAEEMSLSLSLPHWGRGPMETSDYIVNTLKTLVQFTQPFTTRYILGTFQM